MDKRLEVLLEALQLTQQDNVSVCNEEINNENIIQPAVMVESNSSICDSPESINPIAHTEVEDVMSGTKDTTIDNDIVICEKVPEVIQEELQREQQESQQVCEEVVHKNEEVIEEKEDVRSEPTEVQHNVFNRHSESFSTLSGEKELLVLRMLNMNMLVDNRTLNSGSMYDFKYDRQLSSELSLDELEFSILNDIKEEINANEESFEDNQKRKKKEKKTLLNLFRRR